MAFEILMTDMYSQWFKEQDENAKAKAPVKAKPLEEHGPGLRRPHAGDARGSVYPNMRELIAQVGGRPYRVFNLFGSTRKGLLLLGGAKDGAGNNDFYAKLVKEADKLVAARRWK